MPTLDTAFLLHVAIATFFTAAGALLYRSFRRSYLLCWIAGWLLLLAHDATLSGTGLFNGAKHPLVLAGTSAGLFQVALGFFAAGVLLYTHSRRYLLWLGVLTLLAVDLAIMLVRWPGSETIYVLLFLVGMTIRVGAGIRLGMFSWGRSAIGAWMIALALIPLKLHESAGALKEWLAPEVGVEVLLGLGMLVLVLDEARAHADRLDVLSALSAASVGSHELQPIADTALRELMRAVRGSAAWFRVLQDDRLVMIAHRGAPQNFVRERQSIEFYGGLSESVIESAFPRLISDSSADEETRRRLREDGFDHVILVPVAGKNSVIGTLSIASKHHRNYTRDEMRFLRDGAGQLGITLENLRLLDQIRHSQREWVTVFDSIGDCVLVHDEQFTILRVNRALRDRLGMPYQDIVGHTCEAVLPNLVEWEYCPYCWYAAGDTAGGVDPCFGGYSHISTADYVGGAQGDVRGKIHTITDVSRRRIAEERYRRFVQQVQEGIYVSSPDGHIVDCNDAFVSMLGYANKEEVLRLDVATQIYASPGIRQMFLDAISPVSAVRNFEVRLRRKDGAIVVGLESSFATRNAAGEVESYQGFILDITEKTRVEDEIRRRNRELAAANAIASVSSQSFDLQQILNVTMQQVVELFAADTGGIYLIDPKSGKLRRRAMYGHRSASVGQFNELDVPSEFWERMRDRNVQVVTHKELDNLPRGAQELARYERIEGFLWAFLWIHGKIAGVLGISSRRPRDFSAADQELIASFGRQLASTIEKVDLYHQTREAFEELSRTQEQLLQSEKMSAIGQLISGVAHELNNPLTAILGYAQLLEGEELDARSRDFIQKLYRQAQRTHKIVQNLLSFSRQRKPQKQAVDMRRVLEDTLALRDYDLRLNNITVEKRFETELPAALADSHQLEQVFLNIINNAVDAMLERSRGGRLRVRAFSEDSVVCAEFHDTGPGIQDQARIFDPFYTTKPIGKGTGLGLSICYGIIKEHGGEIVAENHAEGGAVFRVKLPVVVEPAPEPVAPQPNRRKVLRGRVLLVDDETAVLEFEKEVLQGAGAEVVALYSGEEAIARMQAESFDAVVIDGKMPGGWSGIDMYRWVAEHKPGFEKHVMFALSNIHDGELSDFIEKNRVLCIVKPFEIADFVAMVRRLLKPEGVREPVKAARATHS